MSQSDGLLASVRMLVGTLLGIVQTRLELLANELEEEGLRLAKVVLYGALGLFFVLMAILLLTVLIVAAFWDGYRLAAIAGVAMLYLGFALVCAACVRHQLKHKPRLFAASLAELGKDRAGLAPRE